MLKAIDESSLPKKYRAVIKLGIAQYADQDGLFFADQGARGDSCGCSRQFVGDAVGAAVDSGLMKKIDRIYSNTGRKGTSIYALLPDLWSSLPDAVRLSMNERLARLTIKYRDVDTVCLTDTPSMSLMDTTEGTYYYVVVLQLMKR
jgi:hypothetical protein